MTRAEHVAWCKERALEFVNSGDYANATASMVSDMNKHPECGMPFAQITTGTLEALKGNSDGVRRWIEAFA